MVHFKVLLMSTWKRQALIINGQIVKMIEAPGPDQVNYEDYGISNAHCLIDNTGAFRNRVELSRSPKEQMESAKVLLTAPGKVKFQTSFMESITKRWISITRIFILLHLARQMRSVRCLALFRTRMELIKVTSKRFTPTRTIKIFWTTSTRKKEEVVLQLLNMVITETGAGAAVTKVIPVLKNKLTANAVRVPVPNGSLAIMNLTLHKETSVEEVNALVKKAALEGNLVNQIKYSIEPELVSSDIVGDTCCSVFDSRATLVHPDKKNVVLYVWYDNEYGYTKQVIRLAKYIANVRRKHYY